MSSSPSNRETASKASSSTKPDPAVARTRVIQRRQLLLRVVAVLSVVAISAFVVLYARQIRAFGSYGYGGIFILSLAANATLIFPAPGWLIPIAAGSAFNPLLVGLVAGTGQTLGELTGFVAGASGRIMLEDRERYERLSAAAKRYGLWIFIVLGVVPNPIFDLAGLAAGALRIPVLHFLGATWVGKTMRATLFAYGGYGIFSRWLNL